MNAPTAADLPVRLFRATEIKPTPSLDPGDYILLCAGRGEVVTVDRPTTLRDLADRLEARDTGAA
jgi:hypothetical protein